MLDELLGRAELKDRITDLEAEIERLEAQLESEEDRRKQAVRDRQEADEQVNRLEDRIADLEGQLERVDESAWTPRFRKTASLRGERLQTVLDRLWSFEAGADGALTAVVGEAIGDPVREAFGSHAGLVDRAAPCIALTDDTGLISVALDPPVLPAVSVDWGPQFQLEREWFVPTGEFGFVLVRSDVFGYGRYVGRERQDFRGFSSDVHGQHSKGGFSQARFERRRDEEIEDHIDKCRAVLDEVDVDRLFVVGERAAIDEFEALATATETVDATGDPEEALDAAFQKFWTTNLYCI